MPADHYLKTELYRQIQRDPAIFDFLQQGSLDGLWYWDLENPEHEWMSPEFWQLFGYDPATKKHKPTEWQQLIHPEDAQIAMHRVQRHLNDPDFAYDQVVRYRHSDGSTVWVRCRGIAIRDENGKPIRMLGAHTDVTALVDGEELRRSRERFRALFEHTHDAALIIDRSGLITDFNQRALESLGYTRTELTDRPIRDVCKSIPVDQWTETLAKLFAMEPPETVLVEGIYSRKDSTLFPVEGRIGPIELDGEKFVLAMIRDTSARKAAEEERQRWETKAQQAQKLESLGVLAGGVAHDFNNLLVGILGYADLAVDQAPEGSEIRELLDRIREGGKRAAELCSQMLAYAGRGRFVVETFDLNDLIRKTIQLLEVSASKTAELRFDLADRAAIHADTTQIRQVLMNLVINASEAMGDHEGVITIRTGNIQHDGTLAKTEYCPTELRRGTYIYLEVSDTGEGIDATNIGKIFDPFFTTKFTGRGLGLAAVLGIARSHGGSVLIESKPGEGTRFRVLFRSTDEEVIPSTAAATTTQRWSGSGTVLFVDDDETVREVGTLMLEQLGFEVVTARDGLEAVQIFSEQPERFCCVVLDLTMPRLGGQATFEKLRSIHSDVRVCLTSGYSEQESVSKFVDRGLAGFLMKPFTLNDLRNRLQQILEGHPSSEDAAEYDTRGA